MNQIKSNRAGWIAAGIISLAAIYLHGQFLARAGGLWRDEVNLVNLSAGNSLADLSHDAFPVLMPLVVKAWSAIGLGRSDLELRMLGVLIGLGLLGSLWFAGWIFQRKPPVLGLALFGINYTAILYGNSLRAYGLGSLLIVVVLAATWWFLEKRSLARAAILAVATILCVQTLFPNAILVAAIFFAALVVCRRRKDWRTAAGILVIGLLSAVTLLPYWSNIFSGREAGSFYQHFNLRAALENFAAATGAPLKIFFYVWCLLALCVIADGATIVFGCLKAAGTVPAGRGENDRRLFVAAALPAGVLGFCGFFFLGSFHIQPWYFLPLLALAAAGFDAGLPPLSARWQNGRVVFAAATALTAIFSPLKNSLCRMTNADLVASRLHAEASREDFVVVYPWYFGISFDRYFQGPAAWSTMPPLADHRLHRYDLALARLEEDHAIQPLLDRIAATLRSGHQVWLAGRVEIPPPVHPRVPDLRLPARRNPGWNYAPYLENWQAQIEAFVSDHSTSFALVNPPAPERINANENMDLARASGWREAMDGTNPEPPSDK